MNEHDAKENLQDMHDVALCRIKNGDARGAIYLPPETLDSYIIGIKALEKQIAKKPMPLLNVYPDGQYECSCDCPVLRCYSYCPKCGQKLDWSDIDE